MEQPELIIGAAREYARRELPIIPLRGKVPAIKDWQQFVANEINIRFWFGPARRCNIGLRTGESGYIVVDTDNGEAEQWVREHLPETPMQALSGGGSRHRYYEDPPRAEIRNRQGWKRIPGLDIRGHGGSIVVAPSIHPETGEAYRWLTEMLPPEDLPRFSPAWVREHTRLCLRTAVIREPDRARLLVRARKYLEKIEPAVSGQGGHNKTFSTACKLARLTNYDPEMLWILLVEYNARCLPPWGERELRHKWEDALKARK